MMSKKNVYSEKKPHSAVLLKEMLYFLAPHAGEKFLDCTFGAGGYSASILDSCECQVVAIDRDPMVQKFSERIKDKYNERFDFIQTDFSGAIKHLKTLKFNGIVMDLGVSSMQLDNPQRGFSFMNDGPLDMRMSSSGISAAEFVNEASEKEIADIIYKYGEETFSRKIANRIIEERKVQPILTTERLAKIVRGVIGFRKGKIDSATKTFQGIRIFINNEHGQLKNFLEKVSSLLLPGGRLVVVSFHSLEDSIVKYFFKENSSKAVAQSKYAKKDLTIAPGKWLKILTKKPITPTDEEVTLNIRSRSAKLRAAIKIEGTYVD